MAHNLDGSQYDPLRTVGHQMQQAEHAFSEWWQDVGCVLSQRISIGLGTDTPQEAMRRVFVDGFLMGLGDRPANHPQEIRTTLTRKIDPSCGTDPSGIELNP